MSRTFRYTLRYYRTRPRPHVIYDEQEQREVFRLLPHDKAFAEATVIGLNFDPAWDLQEEVA